MMPNFLLTPYDYRPGQLGDTTGKQKYGRGSQTLKYLYDDDEEDEFDYEGDVELDIDTHVGINKKIDGHYANLATTSQRGNKKSYSDMMMSEFAGNHKNPTRKGISPYKAPKMSGPPLGGGGSGQAFRTTGNFRGTGTHYGSSRPHKILTDIEDENAWDIRDISDPMERSFLRHSNRVKKVLSLLKEYLNDEII